MVRGSVNLDHLFFFLKQDPYVYPKFRSLNQGDKQRTKEEQHRAHINNLNWTNKILIKLIQHAHSTAALIQKQAKEKGEANGGLDN